MLAGLAIASFAAEALLLLIHRWRRTLGGLPSGELVYSDLAGGATRVLTSTRHGLKGKPDALVRTPSGDLVPVERKKTGGPKQPYDGDLIQVTAYCIRIEENYGHLPPFMRIQYRDRWFDEPYTAEWREWVLLTCDRIRQARREELAIVRMPLLPSAATAANDEIAVRRLIE